MIRFDEAECTLPWNHTGPHYYKRTGNRGAFGPDGRHWVRIPVDELDARIVRGGPRLRHTFCTNVADDEAMERANNGFREECRVRGWIPAGVVEHAVEEGVVCPARSPPHAHVVFTCDLDEDAERQLKERCAV